MHTTQCSKSSKQPSPSHVFQIRNEIKVMKCSINQACYGKTQHHQRQRTSAECSSAAAAVAGCWLRREWAAGRCCSFSTDDDPPRQQARRTKPSTSRSTTRNTFSSRQSVPVSNPVDRGVAAASTKRFIAWCWCCCKSCCCCCCSLLVARCRNAKASLNASVDVISKETLEEKFDFESASCRLLLPVSLTVIGALRPRTA